MGAAIFCAMTCAEPPHLSKMAAHYMRRLPVLGVRFMNITQKATKTQLAMASSLTGNPQVDKALTTATGGRIFHWLEAYENAVGLTEVREAQNKVIQAERDFITVQEERRRQAQEMTNLQNRQRAITLEIDKVNRGDDRYLTLITEEHKIIREENTISESLSSLEESEKLKFSLLSSAVRESHEKERARTERTKYWSIIGSIVGAMVGIIGTTINNYLRMRELRGIVKQSAEGGVETRALVGSLSDSMKSQYNQIQGFVMDLKALLGKSAGKAAIFNLPEEESGAKSASGEQLEAQTQAILEVMGKQEQALEGEMKEIKKLLVAQTVEDIEGNVVYVGPEVEVLLQNTEKNLETRMKMNALWTVTITYGAFALTLPILYSIFRGG